MNLIGDGDLESSPELLRELSPMQAGILGLPFILTKTSTSIAGAPCMQCIGRCPDVTGDGACNIHSSDSQRWPDTGHLSELIAKY